jgi:predicted lipid-binding transport protein (Tim44 family)
MIKHTSTNPLANLLIIAAGIVVIGVSVVLGFFAFVALAAIVSVAAAIIGVRVWWLNRKLGRQSTQKATASYTRKTAGVIEGEYKVVDKDGNEA